LAAAVDKRAVDRGWSLPARQKLREGPVNLPYPLPELDLSAPFDRYRARVVAEWVDPNRHMNMAYYMVAFDKATDVLLEQVGLSYAYTRHELGMIFVLEAHVTYERELCEDDPIGVATRIV